MVIAKVSGEVQEIFVEEGDDVASGQVLARLDGDRLRLESQQAEANLRKLERDFQRNLDLKAKGLISVGDFEKIQYEMEALQASFDLSQLEYGYTEIRSPIDGVISQRLIKVGNTIDVNTETFQVTSLEPLISYLHVPEREYRRIDADQPATHLLLTHFRAPDSTRPSRVSARSSTRIPEHSRSRSKSRTRRGDSNRACSGG